MWGVYGFDGELGDAVSFVPGEWVGWVGVVEYDADFAAVVGVYESWGVEDGDSVVEGVS